MEKQLLIRQSVSGYKHFDLGNIKLAFTQVCKEEIFRNVYFAANSLYYVESGSAEIFYDHKKIIIKKGEICLIKQHSKLDIKKNKDIDGTDFKSIIFYLFPDFVIEFIKQTKQKKSQSDFQTTTIFHLGKHLLLKNFVNRFSRYLKTNN